MRHVPDIILSIFIPISIFIMFLHMTWYLMNNEPHKVNGAQRIIEVLQEEGDDND